MIEQVRAQDIPAGRPAVEGYIRAVRIVSCTPGVDTIAFNNPQQRRVIYGGNTYRSTKSSRIERIYLTGTPIIEYTTDDDEDFDPGTANANIVLRPSYKVSLSGNPLTVNKTWLALESGPKLTLRIRRVRFTVSELAATAATNLLLALGRTTAPSAGGATISPNSDDQTDQNFTGIYRTLPAAITPAGPFTETFALLEGLYSVPVPANVVHSNQGDDWVLDGVLTKPITIKPGGNDGIAITHGALGAGAVGNIKIDLWFTEE